MANEKLIDTLTLKYFESKLSNKYATKSELPTVNNASHIIKLNGTTIGTNFTANASSNVTTDIQALPNYSLSISTAGGNPREVKFVRVNYASFTSNYAAYFKIGAMCSHGNGQSYTFLEDIIIGVTMSGAVTCTVYKQVQNTSTYTVDSHTVHFGDVYWVVDTTNHYVDFYIICGQYATINFTPFTAIGATTRNTSQIVQQTGSATLYSSGTRVWNTLGNGTLYALKSEIPTSTSDLTNDSGFITNSSLSNYVALTGDQTISGLKYFSGNGLKVTGRVAGSGDDEGIVVEPASNSYAGVCCGSPGGRRAVFYLRPTDSCWRYMNGSASYDIVHPAKSGTIALTSDVSSKQDTLVSGTNIKTINNTSILGSGNLTVTATETVAKVTICATETAVAVTGGSAYLFLPYGATGTFANSASGSSYTFYGPALCVGGMMYFSNSSSRNFNSTQYVNLTPLYRVKGIIIKIV